MSAFGFGANENTFHSLSEAYSEKHRHYHTGEHVQACLKHLDVCAAQAEHPIEIEIALWFHDAIYRPLSSNNERKSADWASTFLLANSAPPEVAARVHRLIMVTEHNVAIHTKDESILVDIDLSILGADAKTYDEFEKAVRLEYRIIPMFIYRRKRAAVLHNFFRAHTFTRMSRFCLSENIKRGLTFPMPCRSCRGVHNNVLQVTFGPLRVPPVPEHRRCSLDRCRVLNGDILSVRTPAASERPWLEMDHTTSAALHAFGVAPASGHLLRPPAR